MVALMVASVVPMSLFFPKPFLLPTSLALRDNTLQQIPVCTVAGLIQTQHGPIIGVFHQYAHQGTGKTIHSVSQLRHFGTIVDDTPRHFGGKQRLETLDGYIIPLSIRSGLPYMDMSPPTQEELDTYPHVFFTADMEWHPQSVNNEYHVADLDITEDDLQILIIILVLLMSMVPSFLLPANMTSTLERYNQTNLTSIPFLLILGLSLVCVSNIR